MSRSWLAFWILGVIWGSSFLLIRIGVQEMNPFQVVFIRTAIAAIGINIVLAFQKKHLPLSKEAIPLIIIGIGNTVVPFLLITWGEQTVESGLASVLQATASLISLVIAHFAFSDERLSTRRVLGLITGFLGVLVLGSRSWVDGQIVTGDLAGQFAIIIASLFYALFTAYSRKAIQNNIEPLVISGGAMTTAAIISGALMIISPLVGGVAPIALSELSTDALWSVFLLGFLNTFIAYLLYYSLVKSLGVAVSSMVTYVVPVVGLILGVIILNEQMDAKLIIGAGLIFVGIAIVNLRINHLFKRKVA